MSTSSVTLFYGLWVKTWSLAFAAKAYAKAQPTLLALDLIIARRRSGKLVVEQQEAEKTARDLPEEVWEFVKQEVIDEAIQDEEEQTLETYRCPSCSHALGNKWSVALARDTDSLAEGEKAIEDCWTDWSDPKCDSCVEGITEMYGRFEWFSPVSVVEDITNLLTLGGLQLVSAETFCAAALQWPRFDELSPLALPLYSPATTDYPSTYSHPCGYQHERPDSAATELSPLALRLPSNAELRVRRLISTYRLQVVDPAASTITSVLRRDISDDNVSTRGDSAEKGGKEVFGRREPRWMLSSHMSSCF